MSKTPPRYYWDSCVFISLIGKPSERSPIVTELMHRAQAGKIEVFTSTFAIAEVGFATHEKATKKVDEDVEERIKKLWRVPTPITLVEFHQFHAEESRMLMRSGLEKGWTGLKGKDAVHLATAKLIKVDEFHTYDTDRLAKYSEMIGAKICEPWLDQHVLDMRESSEQPIQALDETT